MAKIDSAQIWSSNYRLVTAVLTAVAPRVSELGLEIKELFLLAEVDDYPHPAELAARCLLPKPTVTVYVKRLEAAGFVRREIDAGDLRRHRLSLTAAGRRAMTRGLALVTSAYGKRLGTLSVAEQTALAAIMKKLS